MKENIFSKIFTTIKEHLSLAIKLILILSILNAIYNNLWHILSTNIFLLILLFLPQLTKKYEIKIPQNFEWLLFLFILFTLFLGKIGGIVAPLAFGISIAFIGFLISAMLYSSNQIKKNYFLIISFSFNFALAFGALLEILKYYLKYFMGHTITAEIYAYSMRNMLFVILGALIATLFGYLYMKGYKGIIRELGHKFLKFNPKLLKHDNEKEILELIKKGENEKIEFKSTLRINLHTNELDKKIEYSVLKTITAFMNCEGGIILIGISNEGEVIGIEKDRFENEDKFNLHLTNIIKEKIGKKQLSLVEIQIFEIENKKMAKIECKKSDNPIFLKPNPKEEEFYIRIGPSNAELKGSELVDYIEKRFQKKK